MIRCTRPLDELAGHSVPLGPEFRETDPHMPPDEPEALSDAEQVVPPGMTDEQARAMAPNLKSQIVTSNNPKDVASRSKCPVDLVPPCLIRSTAEALKSGAAKYGEFNWRTEPVQLRNYLAAIMRHTLAILDGDDYDADSGLEHLSHIAATCAIVMDAADHGTLIDDRPGK